MDYSLLLGIEINQDVMRRSDSFASDRSDNNKDGPNQFVPCEDAELGEIHNEEKGKENPTEFLNALQRHKTVSKCGKYTYHLAIIDYLCHYNYEKKGENFLKTFFRN